MINYRKIENNMYEIIIPDEGVNYKRNIINFDLSKNKRDVYLMSVYTYWSNFTTYYTETIDEIYAFLNGKNNLNYELIEVYQAEKDINLLSVFKIKCDDKTINKLLKKIKNLINNRKNNYK